MDKLADFAVAELGRVDIWVNNAGASQPVKGNLTKMDAAAIQVTPSAFRSYHLAQSDRSILIYHAIYTDIRANMIVQGDGHDNRDFSAAILFLKVM